MALSREDVVQLWDLQRKAYSPLVGLAEEANGDPAILSPDAVALWTEPDSRVGWLRAYRERFLVWKRCGNTATNARVDVTGSGPALSGYWMA